MDLGHSFHNEWVYNEADIDGAKVIFARAMNSRQDCQLVEYFKSRRIWSLDADQSIPKLEVRILGISANETQSDELSEKQFRTTFPDTRPILFDNTHLHSRSIYPLSSISRR